MLPDVYRPAPEMSPDEPVRLVVRSIGTAAFAIVGALRQISALTEQELAGRLFRAPSELFSGVPRATAEKAAEILTAAGLEVEVLAAGESSEPGDGDHDVALVPTDFSRMKEVAQEVVRFLGVSAKVARQIVCAEPSILVGGVSTATVAALRRRFGPLGVELAVSRPATSCFDVVLGECAASVRPRLLAALGDAGLTPPVDDAGPLVALGLDRAAADRVWEQVGRKTPALRILDRAFERFDVRLEACPRAAVPELVALTGMPEKVAFKALERLPIVVQQNLDFAATRACVERLARAGAVAVDELRALQSFAVVIESVADRPLAARALRALADVAEDAAEPLLHALPARIEGPLGMTQARWLQAELRAVGAAARLVRR